MKLDDPCDCGATDPTTKPNAECERCRLVWIVATTQKMRAAQAEYFKTRNPTVLDRSKSLERQVDSGISRLLAPARQREMFD